MIGFSLFLRLLFLNITYEFILNDLCSGLIYQTQLNENQITLPDIIPSKLLYTISNKFSANFSSKKLPSGSFETFSELVPNTSTQGLPKIYKLCLNHLLE